MHRINVLLAKTWPAFFVASSSLGKWFVFKVFDLIDFSIIIILDTFQYSEIQFVGRYSWKFDWRALFSQLLYRTIFPKIWILRCLKKSSPKLRFPDGRTGSRDKRGEREKEETLHPRSYGRFYVSLLVRTRGIREVPIQFGNIFADLLSSPLFPEDTIYITSCRSNGILFSFL